MSNSNEQSYNKIADKFASSRDESSVPVAVSNFAKLLRTGDSVLDVGCGSGVPNAKHLVEEGMRVTGIDISEALLAIAKKNVPGATFLKSDIVDFQSTEKFDGIIAWDSLFHLRLNEQKHVFEKLYDLLDVGGYLLFTHGGSEGEIEGEMHGEKFVYSSLGPEKLKKLLETMGFKVNSWEMDASEENGYMIALVQK
jgi:predicted TPR repeat methyltransferase